MPFMVVFLLLTLPGTFGVFLPVRVSAPAATPPAAPVHEEHEEHNDYDDYKG